MKERGGREKRQSEIESGGLKREVRERVKARERRKRLKGR